MKWYIVKHRDNFTFTLLLQKQGGMVWTGYVYFRTGTSGGLLWTR